MKVKAFLFISSILFCSCSDENPSFVNQYFFTCADFESADFTNFNSINDECFSLLSEDNFDNPKRWNFSTSDLKISNGKLDINSLASNWCLRLSDIEVEKEEAIEYFLEISSHSSGQIGLFFESRDCDDLNLFTMDGSKVYINEIFDNKVSNKFSKQFIVDNAIKLTIRMIKSTFYFFINGEYLTSISNLKTHDSEFGIYLGKGAEGKIDLVKVSYIF